MPTYDSVKEIAKIFSTQLPDKTVTSKGVVITIADSAGVSMNVTATWVDAWNTTPSVDDSQEVVNALLQPDEGPSKLSAGDITLCQQALGDCRRIMWFSSRNVTDVAKSCIILMKHFMQTRPAWQALPVWVLLTLCIFTIH